MPNDDRPAWNRRRPARPRRPRNAAARPWYADRLEKPREFREAKPLGPYETAYDVSRGYSWERVREGA
ncbi:MAG: hypothetical protein GX539_14175 [Candidatus Cloacimonetes bacterium]|jgi:hypothetical protein|nr:hypothetical protein [Candidatus Cloacimonadota bacterium]